MYMYNTIINMIFLTASTGGADISVDIWQRLADAGLVFLIMGVGLVLIGRYLKTKDKIIHAKDEQLIELNTYVRENDKNNLVVLSEVNHTLDKIIETQKVISERTMEGQKINAKIVIKEITSLKETIELRVENLSDKIDNNKKK